MKWENGTALHYTSTVVLFLWTHSSFSIASRNGAPSYMRTCLSLQDGPGFGIQSGQPRSHVFYGRSYSKQMPHRCGVIPILQGILQRSGVCSVLMKERRPISTYFGPALLSSHCGPGFTHLLDAIWCILVTYYSSCSFGRCSALCPFTPSTLVGLCERNSHLGDLDT